MADKSKEASETKEEKEKREKAEKEKQARLDVARGTWELIKFFIK